MKIENIVFLFVYFQETLKQLFRSWWDCVRYSEVIVFSAGLMQDPRPLIQHMYEMYIERRQNVNRTGETDEQAERQLEAQGKRYTDVSLFESLYTESVIPLPGHPYHNEYINIYTHSVTPRDTTPITTPSQYYYFGYMSEEVVLDTAPVADLPECFMVIVEPQAAVTKGVLSTCRAISERQPITDLVMSGVRCGESAGVKPLIISSNARSVVLTRCALPAEYLSGILRQLTDCGATLQRLWLREIDLQPVEAQLDALLEALTSHHQQTGPAHGKLLLQTQGNEIKTNLSEGFVRKWREKCQNIESIDHIIY